MILKCPCGHQFVPWVREVCPNCGGDSGIQRIEGWLRYHCACAQVALPAVAALM